MAPELSPTLLRILSSTVLEIERSLVLPDGDPGLRELKQSILLALGELEWKRAAGSRMRILWIRAEYARRGFPANERSRWALIKVIERTVLNGTAAGTSDDY